MKYVSFSYITKLVILFVLYFLGGKLGILINAAGGHMTLFWPPLGIGLAALLLFGYRLWPAIFLGALLIPLSNNIPLHGAVLVGFANTLNIIVCAYILQRFVKFKKSFSGVNDVIGFAFVAVPAGAAVGASLAAVGLLLGGFADSSIQLWQKLWASDILSYLIITPLLLTWYENPRISYNRSQIAELLLLLIFSFYCALFTFTNIFIKAGPMTYMVFPSIIWAALRFGQRETAVIVVAFCIGAILSTIYGTGPFRAATVGETLAHVQSFISILAITSLMLAALVQERKEIEKRKDEFIGIASHELKTPLTSIKAYVQIIPSMIKKGQEKNALQYLKNTDEQLDKLTHLVSDLLNISKIQAGKLELREELFSLSVLVTETVKTIQSVSKTHEIYVRGKISRLIYADKEKIGQVLNNLLSNAIKYSPDANKIIVTLSQKKDFVQIDVQDFGIGIPGNKLRRIFNRFYQLEKDGQPRAGFGLGLYISSEIIKLHQGRIWAESIEGKGSTFCFILPFREEV